MSLKKDMSLNKHQLSGPSGKYEPSQKAQKLEEGIISQSKLDVWKVDSDKKDSDFECYDKYNGMSVHLDVDKEIIGSNQKDPTPAVLPNTSEEEKVNNNGETWVGNGNTSVRRSLWTFKPPERLCSVPYFWIWYNV